MLSGSALITIADLLLKVALAGSTSLSILGIRSLFVVTIVLLLAVRVGLKKVVHTRQQSLHILRVVAGVAGTIAFFESLRHLPLATAVILSFLTPLIMNAMAPFFVAEPVYVRHIVGAIVGFLGAAIVIGQPEAHQISLVGVVYGLASSFLLALSWVIVRRIGRRDHPLSFLLFLNVGTLAAGLGSIIAVGFLPSLELSLAAGTMAVLVLAGNLLMVKAYMLAPVAVVAPFTYSQLLWAVVLQVIVWNEMPTPPTMVGATLIIAAGLIVILLPSGSSRGQEVHGAGGGSEAPNKLSRRR
jgi:drug/metabolite transporter (DMT)-like permease